MERENNSIERPSSLHVTPWVPLLTLSLFPIFSSKSNSPLFPRNNGALPLSISFPLYMVLWFRIGAKKKKKKKNTNTNKRLRFPSQHSIFSCFVSSSGCGVETLFSLLFLIYIKILLSNTMLIINKLFPQKGHTKFRAFSAPPCFFTVNMDSFL
ncbi:hypothetical protein RIF29_21440 [Crotalaria pallida]|uniref:Uncharacterized protein n=1 Tax=Crotalaria pallida TaxID=3830 RepID=A0AAN9I773_CROPI